jgi:hypothetical protein
MTPRSKFVVSTAALAALAAGIALATPQVGLLFSSVLATGTVNHDVNARAHVALAGSEEGFSAQVETEGAANFLVLDAKYAQGGTTGWHSHPGILLLSLAADSGPIDWYDANCVKHVYNAGDSWTEGTSLHDVVFPTAQGAHFVITYILPKGVGRRTDQAPPACAAALGLN